MRPWIRPKATFSQTGKRIEERRTLEQHAEAREVFVARRTFESDDLFARDFDRARIGADDAEDGLDHHRLAGAGAADDDERAAFADRDIEAVQDLLLAEGLANVGEDDVGFLGHRLTPRTGRR